MAKVTQLPNTKNFTMGGLTLNLRLNGTAIIQIEQRLRKSIMSLFISPQGGMQIPPTNELLIVLQGANATHGVTDKKIVEAFGTFVDEGHSTMELVNTVQELLEEAGFFSGKTDESETDSESPKEAEILLETPEENGTGIL